MADVDVKVCKHGGEISLGPSSVKKANDTLTSTDALDVRLETILFFCISIKDIKAINHGSM